MTQPHIFIATPAYGAMVTTYYLNSFLQLMAVAGQRDVKLTYRNESHDSLIPRARNRFAGEFMASKEFTHFLFIDADLGFDPEAIYRMLEFDRPVIGGVYPIKNLPLDAAYTSMQKGVEHAEDRALEYVISVDGERMEVDPKGFAPVKAVGTGFMLIKRETFDILKEKYPDRRYQSADTRRVSRAGEHVDEAADEFWAFFDTMIDPDTGTYLPEDWGFCKLCRDAGIPIWADVVSRFTHYGGREYTGSIRHKLGL